MKKVLFSKRGFVHHDALILLVVVGIMALLLLPLANRLFYQNDTMVGTALLVPLALLFLWSFGRSVVDQVGRYGLAGLFVPIVITAAFVYVASLLGIEVPPVELPF